MKIVYTILFFVTCSLSSTLIAQTLNDRVALFKSIMIQTELSEDEYSSLLLDLFDPTENVDSISRAYYKNWKYNANLNSFLVSTETIKIVYNRKKNKAKVFIKDIWKTTADDYIEYYSKSFWVLKDNVWYRNNDQMEILQAKRITYERPSLIL